MSTTETTEQTPTAVESPWDFACGWYNVHEVHACIIRRNYGDKRFGGIPCDIGSREFAEWLTNEYRLAMAKGIEIGRRWQRQNVKLTGPPRESYEFRNDTIGGSG